MSILIMVLSTTYGLGTIAQPSPGLYPFASAYLGERMLGIVAVAAPVIDAKGATIAALSVTGTADRLPAKEIERLSLEVRDAAKMIAERYDGGSWTN